MNSLRGCIAQSNQDNPRGRVLSQGYDFRKIEIHREDDSLVPLRIAKDFIIGSLQHSYVCYMDGFLPLNSQPLCSFWRQGSVDQETHAGLGRRNGWERNGFLAGHPGRIFDGFRDITCFKIRIFLQDLGGSLIRRQKVQYLMNREPHSADAGLPAQNLRVDGDSSQ